MDELNIKQLGLSLRTIAEEKNLPEDTVLAVIEQAIAAAWRRDNGEREQNVRASLNMNDGTAVVSVVREIVDEEDLESDVTQDVKFLAKKERDKTFEPDMSFRDIVLFYKNYLMKK